MTAIPQVGDKLITTIERLAFGGEGIARLNGIICFVIGGVIPQETVKIEITQRKGGKRAFLHAKLLEVLEASPLREEPPCPYFSQCGGCSYQHITYSEQLRIKQEQLREALQRIAGLENPLVHPTVASPLPFGYRNRIRLHVQEGEIGFFRKKREELIPIEHCLLASEEVNQRFQELRQSRPHDGDYLIGEEKKYGGFRQVNATVASLLGNFIQEKTGKGKILIDAYCGNGFFANLLQDQFERIIGIERACSSLKKAQAAAAPHQEFLEGNVEEALPPLLAQFSQEELQQTTLLLDPPSEGIDKHLATTLLTSPVPYIIYISCNPTTLARDITRLAPQYRVEESTPFDMFAQTAQIESVTLLRSSS